MIESLFGLERHVDHLTVRPVVPQEWGSFRMYYRYYQSHYNIEVIIHGPETWEVRDVMIDGNRQEGDRIPLINDGRDHYVVVNVGGSAADWDVSPLKVMQADAQWIDEFLIVASQPDILEIAFDFHEGWQGIGGGTVVDALIAAARESCGAFVSAFESSIEP
jgi:hypothetical protein